MIFSGPLFPKFIAEAFVASEKVGEGGPRPGFGCLFAFGGADRVRSERGVGMVVRWTKGVLSSYAAESG